VIVVDGMRGTAATQTVFIEHVGIPTLAAVAADALEDLDMRGKVQPLWRYSAQGRCCQRIAMGDAVSLGQGIPLPCNSETYIQNGTHHSWRTTLHSARTVTTREVSRLVTTQDEIWKTV